MKNKDLFGILNCINAIGNINSSVKFSYAMAKNKKKIEAEISAILEGIKPSEAYKAYEQKRMDLCDKYSAKDVQGKAIIENNSYKIENREQFEKDIAKLQEKNKETLEVRKKQEEEYAAFLELESTFNPSMVKLEDVPCGISVLNMDGIYPLIEE